MPQYLQFFISFGGVCVPVILFYWKLRVDVKKAKEEALAAKKIADEEILLREAQRDDKEDKRIEKQTKHILEQIYDLGVKVTELEEILKAHVSDSDFRMHFRDTVSNKILELLKASDMDMEFKNVLSYWFTKIENFTLDFYYSSHRKTNVTVLGINLNEGFEILMSEFTKYLDMTISDMRLYNGNKVIFSKYLEMVYFFGKSRVLVNTLANNGLDEKAFKDLIINYISQFHSDFITALRVWRRCKRIGFAQDEEEAA